MFPLHSIASSALEDHFTLFTSWSYDGSEERKYIKKTVYESLDLCVCSTKRAIIFQGCFTWRCFSLVSYCLRVYCTIREILCCVRGPIAQSDSGPQSGAGATNVWLCYWLVASFAAKRCFAEVVVCLLLVVFLFYFFKEISNICVNGALNYACLTFVLTYQVRYAASGVCWVFFGARSLFSGQQDALSLGGALASSL